MLKSHDAGSVSGQFVMSGVLSGRLEAGSLMTGAVARPWQRGVTGGEKSRGGEGGREPASCFAEG